MQKNPKRNMTKQIITAVVRELIGDDALEVVFYLRGKSNVSEFIVAEDLELEIHKARNILYRLLEYNLVYFLRKKDKKKGWYICYWNVNEKVIPHLIEKIRKERLSKYQERLSQEQNNQFYMCRNACARMDFEKAFEFEYKCPECNEIMNQQDNQRTIEFLNQKIAEL